MSTTATTTHALTYAADTASSRENHGPVLLATDGRARTDATAIAARLAAERLGASIEVLGVVRPLPIYSLGYELPALPSGFEDESCAVLETDIGRRLEPVLGARERWRLDVRYGSPAREIADAARERRAALIVVGTGGHGRVDRLLGEEVSLDVVRHASTPVLAVAPDLNGPVRRVVVGVDFGAASVRAARTALALIDPGPDEPGFLTLVHVRSPLEARLTIAGAWAAEYEASVAAMFARLRAMLRPYVRDDVTVETRVREGDVVGRLLEVAEETGADLVAVGTHGPGWVERLVVGSVAATTLRRAGRTVLVAPVPDAAERVRLELRLAGQVALSRPEDWGGALDAFTRRNLLRRARLEVSEPEADGFVVGAGRYRFTGATYDPHDRRVEIMLGDEADGARHLTHAVADVRAVEIVAQDARGDRTLLIEDAGGHTVLTLLD